MPFMAMLFYWRVKKLQKDHTFYRQLEVSNTCFVKGLLGQPREDCMINLVLLISVKSSSGIQLSVLVAL